MFAANDHNVWDGVAPCMYMYVLHTSFTGEAFWEAAGALELSALHKKLRTPKLQGNERPVQAAGP